MILAHSAPNPKDMVHRNFLGDVGFHDVVKKRLTFEVEVV
jgi:hypothetical protein